MMTKRTNKLKLCLYAGIAMLSSLANTAHAQWTAVGSNTGISNGGTSYQSLTRDAAGNLYVAFQDSSASKGSIMKYDGTSWSYVGGGAGITAGNTLYNSLAVSSSNQLYYATQDAGAGTKLAVQQYGGNTQVNNWQNLSIGQAYYTSLKIGPSGYPYVAYRDLSTSSGLMVKRYNGADWQRLGAPAFGVTTPIAGLAYSPSMVIGTNDTVYVASVHVISGTQVFKQYALADSQTAWQQVGTTGYATSSNSIFQTYSALAIDGTNRLYLAYAAASGNGNKLNVKRYENGQWTSVGLDNFTAGAATYISIAVTPTGTPYVAFSDGTNAAKTTVMKYDGTSWVTVGTAGISAGAAKNNSLTLDAAGNPVVAFSDAGNGNKTMVMKFIPPCTNTDPGTIAGSTSCVTFTYSGNTVTYTTVRGADGNVWLQQNLGSTGVATSNNDTAAYGDVFQFGRWDDGHQKRNAATAAAPAINNPSGIGTGSANFYTGTPAWWTGGALTDTWDAATPAAATATNGCDPCKAIGAGWRLPTTAEWITAVSSEGIVTPANTNAYNSHLKLTTGGNRTSSGSYDFVGTRGYYWSSTPSTTGGKYYYFSAAANTPSAGDLRVKGMSIRCLKGAIISVDSVKVGVLNSAPATIATNGGTLALTATVYPSSISQNVTWSLIAGTGTASISPTGTVTATTNGTVWAKAVSVVDPTKKDSIQINISNQVVPATNLVVRTQGNVSPAITTNGGTLQMVATISPAGASQNVTWSVIPGTGTATISATGFITAQTNGTVWAKAISVVNTALADSMQLTISNQIVPATSIVVSTQGNVTPVIVANAGTLQMIATVLPATASQSVTWSVVPGTGNAVIGNTGLISALNDGTVWAKATAVGNPALKDSMLVTISGQVIPVDSIDVNVQNGGAPTITTAAGTLQMQALVYPSGANQGVTWTVVRGTGTASIGATGLVTAQSNGTIWARAISIVNAMVKDSLLITITNQNSSSVSTINTGFIKVYPNPVQGSLYLQAVQKHPELCLRITDIQGRIALQQTIPANELLQTATIQTGSWPKGNYFFLLEGNAIQVKQMITLQ